MTRCRIGRVGAQRIGQVMAAVALAWWLNLLVLETAAAQSVPPLDLPADPVNAQFDEKFASLVADSYFDITFSGVPADSDIRNVMYTGWCVDPYSGPPPFDDQIGPVQLYSTYGTLPPAAGAVRWDRINYLINHKNNQPNSAIQPAIWYLITGDRVAWDRQGWACPVGGACDSLVQDAIANGTNFVPGPGQRVAVLQHVNGISFTKDVDDGWQETIVEVPLGEIGDLVWYDQDLDGIQDPNEPGYNGVIASLYANATCTGSPVASTASGGTGTAGLYMLPTRGGGPHCVQFSGLPAGWTISPANQGNGTNDSKADPASGRITNINPDPNDYDQDIGVFVTGTIRDRLICPSSGEGIASIDVTLFNDNGCDGTGDGAPIRVTETAGDGSYLFANLPVALTGDTQNQTCYVVAVNAEDPDLGACSVPLATSQIRARLTSSKPHFQPTSLLRITEIGGGVAAVTPSGPHTNGQVVTLTATAAAGWSFAGWSGALSTTSNPTQYTISGDAAITATFGLNPQPEFYQLTVTQLGSGVVSVQPIGPFTAGQIVTLTAVPAAGWSFDGWSGSVTGVTTPVQLTITGNAAVTATFSAPLLPEQYSLSVTRVGSGDVAVAPAGPYTNGQVVTLTATPAAGWAFAGWSGALSGTGNPAQLTITGDAAVTALFVAIKPPGTFSLTVTRFGSGTVTAQPGGPYTLGQVVTLTAVPEAGWSFSEWSGAVAGSTTPVQLTIEGDAAVTATFAEVSGAGTYELFAPAIRR
jgi:hypothetical protein